MPLSRNSAQPAPMTSLQPPWCVSSMPRFRNSRHEIRPEGPGSAHPSAPVDRRGRDRRPREAAAVGRLAPASTPGLEDPAIGNDEHTTRCSRRPASVTRAGRGRSPARAGADLCPNAVSWTAVTCSHRLLDYVPCRLGCLAVRFAAERGTRLLPPARSSDWSWQRAWRSQGRRRLSGVRLSPRRQSRPMPSPSTGTSHRSSSRTAPPATAPALPLRSAS